MSYSNNNEEVFERAGQKVLQKLRNKVSFPKEVIWVVGPKNEATTTVVESVAETRKHRRKPLILKYNGQDFGRWLEHVLLQVSNQSSRDGIIVCSYFQYPEECVKSLYHIHKFTVNVRASKQRRGRPLPYTKYKFILLNEAAEEEVGDASENHNLDRAAREKTVVKKLETDLLAEYKFNPVEIKDTTEETIQAVHAELAINQNGQPSNYTVTKMPVVKPEGPYFPRANTWHAPHGGTPQGNGRFWQGQRDFRGPPMSPFGNFGYHSSMTPNSYSRFTFPGDDRGYNPTGSPRQMPTSCRLSQMAENDRHSFFPSSARSHRMNQSFQRHPSMNSMQDLPSGSPMTPTNMRRISIKSTDSSKIRDVFLKICASLEGKVGKENLTYPREIIWMIGPPGAGKSTLARFLSEQRDYKSEPIVLREICQIVIAQNDGKLKIEQVVEMLMKKLFEEQYINGVVVDGFVSITCARVVPFMFKYFHEIYELRQQGRAPPVFKFCVLYVNEDNSVRRQLVNYEQGEKKPGRKKFDAEDGRKLYRKFLKRTQQVVELIEMHFSFHLIDANGTLAQVQLIASAEISSDSNGHLNHDATLTKALSPAASSQRSRRGNQNWKQNSTRSNNNSFRANSSRSNFGNREDSIRLDKNTSSFRLAPKNSSIQFHSNLSVDISKHVSQVEDRELLTTLRAAVLEITQGADGETRPANNRLPSAKLMPLDTKNVKNLNAETYFVRPNVRGTHCMMYWDQAGHCYLIDRRFNFFTLQSEFYQAAHVGEGLLDGVMVVDTNNKLVFVAHDAATHRSKRLKDCWFSQRGHECKTAVKDLNAASDGSEPIHLLYLECSELTGVKEIMGQIAQKESGDGRLLTVGDRQIAVHGLTFIPDKAGFHAKEGSKIHTWTFKEDAVRDFKVKAPYDAEQIAICLQGPRNVDSVFQRSNFPEEHGQKYQEIVAKALKDSKTEWFIMSCQYSKETQLWVPVAYQEKKSRASPINAVAENPSSWENRISLEDLYEALPNESAI